VSGDVSVMFREERLLPVRSLTAMERRVNREKLLLVLLKGLSKWEERFSEDLLLMREDASDSGRESVREVSSYVPKRRISMCSKHRKLKFHTSSIQVEIIHRLSLYILVVIRRSPAPPLIPCPIK
jgi:hypothetical protein